jgi:hypothetical protein
MAEGVGEISPPAQGNSDQGTIANYTQRLFGRDRGNIHMTVFLGLLPEWLPKPKPVAHDQV